MVAFQDELAIMKVNVAHVISLAPLVSWCKQHVAQYICWCLYDETFVFECEHTAAQFALIWGGHTQS